jgi:hypothetical protein
MHVPVVAEFDYTNSGPQTLPAGETVEYEYYAPVGFKLLSWGYTTLDPSCRIRSATITPGGTEGHEERGVRFTSQVENPDTVNHHIRWTFILLKV